MARRQATRAETGRNEHPESDATAEKGAAAQVGARRPRVVGVDTKNIQAEAATSKGVRLPGARAHGAERRTTRGLTRTEAAQIARDRKVEHALRHTKRRQSLLGLLDDDAAASATETENHRRTRYQALHEREHECRVRERAEGEQRVLAWWGKCLGLSLPDVDLVTPEGRAADPMMQLIGRGGIVSALRVLDVGKTAEHAQLRNMFYHHLEMPSLERLQMANQVLNALDAALHGNDDRVWRAVQAGLDAMRIDARYIAIECVQELTRYQLGVLEYGGDPRNTFRTLVHRAPPREAFERLRALDRGFSHLTSDDVFDALKGVTTVEPSRGRAKSSLVALARLMVKTRAFGTSVSKTQAQDGNDPVRAEKRVTRALSQAWSQEWKRRRKKGSKSASFF